jgi:hypothetical protein
MAPRISRRLRGVLFGRGRPAPAGRVVRLRRSAGIVKIRSKSGELGQPASPPDGPAPTDTSPDAEALRAYLAARVGESPLALVELGDLELDRGNQEAARRWYEATITTGDPDEAPRALAELGRLALANEDWTSARRWFNRAAEAGNTSALYLLGNLLAQHAPSASSSDLLTPAEVASLFRVDPNEVARWGRSGVLSSVRTVGGNRRYREAEVRALLAGLLPRQAEATERD